MKKITLSVALLLFGGAYIANAQVGIGTATPATSSQLDIVASDKGVLIPRVNLTSTTVFTQIKGTQEESLLVYNLNTAGDATAITAGTNVTPGFYYWTPINTKVTPNIPAHWERIVNQTQLNEAIKNVTDLQGDVDNILALLKVAFPSNNLVDPAVGGDTHGGGMVYTPGDGTTDPMIEYVYFDTTTNTYLKKDITGDIIDIIKGAESKTTILEFPADSGKFYYISEATIQKASGVIPTTPFKAGSTTVLEDGVVFLDIPESVIKNFETILDGRTTIVKPGTTNQFFTVEEYIQYLSSTVDGNVIYKNIAAAGDPANFVFQYWNGTTYTTINLGDIVAANETKTFIKEVVLANGNTQYIYFSEKTIQDWLAASASNTVANIPNNAPGVVVIDATSDVVQNFESILNQTTQYNGDTVTIEEIINEIAGKIDGNVIYKNIGDTTTPNWVFQYWDGTTYQTIDLGDIVKANETNTTLVKDVVADLAEPIVYTYANENFIKGVAGATESKIEITADMVTSITNNEDVQNAITKILNQGGNVFFTRTAIAAGTPTGQLAIPANNFYTVDANGVKMLINLADLVTGLETETRIIRVEDPTAKEVIYSYAHEANKPNSSGISTIGTPDVLNVTEDVLYSITNNGDVIEAITNILKQGGNVFFGDHDGDNTTSDVLYTVIAGVNTPIDISGTVLQVITNNVENIKNILGDKINNSTVVKTGDTFNGGDVYIFASTTDIAANSAETTGITIPAGIVPGTIIGIKVINMSGISSNVTDILITDQTIDFNVGTGNMYNVLGAGTYDVIVEFTE